MWEKVKLGRLCKIRTGKLDVNAENPTGLYPFFTCSKNHTYIDDYAFNEEAIIVAGNGDLNVKYYKGKFNAYQRTYVINPFTNINGKFLFYFLDQYVSVLRNESIGGVIKYIKLGNLTEALIPLPPLHIQEKIAEILDKAGELRRKDQELQAKYDQLAQAIFIDMFGDPVKNEKGWEVKRLEELGFLKNGLNYGNNESGKELKVFGVGDFKSNWLFNDYGSLKTLTLDNIPNKNFLLDDGDILFVRSNGNKDLIGRAILFKNINELITYSGFCIKFTKTSLELNEYYLIRLLVNPKFKKYILNGGRGANIQNINQEILSSLSIPIPPIHLQEEFAKKIEIINQLKTQTNAQKSEELFQSLLQKAFKGELVS